ncbi:MAG: alanine dehydrogenase [Deltaproteobacteria bacterium]|nr:alanine dehydrogenase [Deltaproteobacteria bacterium]
MIVGVLKEIKAQENRVCMTPAGVEVMRQNGHIVLVEAGAGLGSGFADAQYTAAGAAIVGSPAEIYAQAEMVMHVKEPLPREYPLIRPDQIVFTYFHFAADEELTRAFMKTGAVAIAYETVEGPRGGLPLLMPMSEVAGRMAAQEAAKYNERAHGGRGILLGGVTGVAPAEVLVLGGGIVGTNAALMAAGLGARVHILDMNLDRLRYLSEIMPKNVTPLMSSPAKIRELSKEADAIIGAVLVVGAKAPKLIRREMFRDMKPGCVLVDVAIDQGGCFETSKPTTHSDPIYEVDGIIHYCVANMPGAVPITSTMALTNATLPYALQIANKGWKQACRDNQGLKMGLNMVGDKITFKGVAEAFGLPHTPADSCL